MTPAYAARIASYRARYRRLSKARKLGLTYAEIGAEYGLSTKRVWQILNLRFQHQGRPGVRLDRTKGSEVR